LKDTLGAAEDVTTRIKAVFKEKFNLSPIFNEEALNLKPVTERAPPTLA